MAIRIDSALNAIPHQMMDEFNHETARGGRGPFSDIILPLNAALLDRAERLKAKDAEIERLRVQLAGCGVAAMQNTEESRKQRASKGDYGWSESYADVCRAVDEQIELRKKLEQVEQAQPVGLMTVDKDARAYSLLQYEAFADLPSGKHEIYTRPAAPVKPLSLDAINEWSQRRIRAAGGIEGVTNIPSIMEEAVRFAEAAHGIKERK